MAISLPDARQLSDEVLQSLRLRALRGCESAYSDRGGGTVGLSRETVSRWWTAYVDHGLEALPGDRTGRPVGSGRPLNDGQAARLRTILNGKAPRRWGSPPRCGRTGRRRVDRKEYGIDMPVRTVGEYLERRGYTARCRAVMPRIRTPRRSAIGWRSPTAIKARARREDAEIHRCDETGEAATSTATGVTPARGGRRGSRCRSPLRMNLISTISNEGSVHSSPTKRR